MYQWSLYNRRFEEAGVYRQAREDAISATEVADDITVEAVRAVGTDEDFSREMRF